MGVLKAGSESQFGAHSKLGPKAPCRRLFIVGAPLPKGRPTGTYVGAVFYLRRVGCREGGLTYAAGAGPCLSLRCHRRLPITCLTDTDCRALATRTLPARYQYATSTLPVRYQHATSTLPACHQHATSTLPVHAKKFLSARYEHATSTPQACYQHATSLLSARYKLATSTLQAC